MKCPYCIKICTECGRILVANKINFHKGIGKYGLISKCKICRKQYVKENEKEIKEYQKKYREEHKEEIKQYREEYKEEMKEYNKQYNIEHKEEIKEKKKQYYNENKKEIRKKQKQYYNENKEDILKQNKKYREEHEEYFKEYRKQYYKNNKEEILEQHKQYYQDNKEEVLERCNRYRDNNPDKVFNWHNKRRLLEENQGNGIDKDQWYEMMEFFDWKCAYSGEYIGGDSKDRTIDHIIPLNKGGNNSIWNCVPMHHTYNSGKKDKDMLDWYIKQSFYSEERLNRIYEWIEYAYNKWFEDE